MFRFWGPANILRAGDVRLTCVSDLTSGPYLRGACVAWSTQQLKISKIFCRKLRRILKTRGSTKYVHVYNTLLYLWFWGSISFEEWETHETWITHPNVVFYVTSAILQYCAHVSAGASQAEHSQYLNIRSIYHSTSIFLLRTFPPFKRIQLQSYAGLHPLQYVV